MEEQHLENKTVSKQVSPMFPEFSDTLWLLGGAETCHPPPASTLSPTDVPHTEKTEMFNLRFLEGESSAQQGGIFRPWALSTVGGQQWHPAGLCLSLQHPSLPGPQAACCRVASNPRGSEAPEEVPEDPPLFSEQMVAKSTCWGPELPT